MPCHACGLQTLAVFEWSACNGKGADISFGVGFWGIRQCQISGLPWLEIKSRRFLKVKGDSAFRNFNSIQQPGCICRYGNFFSSHNGLRLVSVLLPLSEQRELVLCPIGPAGWHGRRVVFVGRKCSKHFVSMVRIRHEGIVTQVYLVTLHVRNIDGAKQWLDVTRE